MVILFISVPSFVFASSAQLIIVNINNLLGRNIPYRGSEALASEIIPAMILGGHHLSY